MGTATNLWALSCGILLVAACSSSGSAGPDDGGGTDSTAGDDGSSGTPPPGSDATITCHGPSDCGGAGHACCYSQSTNATMCVTGDCGTNYTQCVMDADCPSGLACIQSPLGAGVHYCAPGEGGLSEGGLGEGGGSEGGASEGGASEGGDGGGATDGTPSEGSADSSADGATE